MAGACHTSLSSAVELTIATVKSPVAARKSKSFRRVESDQKKTPEDAQQTRRTATRWLIQTLQYRFRKAIYGILKLDTCSNRVLISDLLTAV